MKFFVLPSILQRVTVNFIFNTLLLGILVLLTSCTNFRKPVKVITPPKVFQYSYQEPSRQLIDSALSQKLSNGKFGDMLYIKYDGKSSTIRIGKNYYSANGHACRRYTINPSHEKTACKINNRWYQAKPILIKE